MRVLEKLVEYYDIQRAIGNIPKMGYNETTVTGVVLFDSMGNFVDIQPLGDKQNPVEMVLPATPTRSSNTLASFGADKSQYSLGVDYKTNTKNLVDSADKFEAFAKKNKEVLSACTDTYIQAFINFLDTHIPSVPNFEPYKETILSRSGYLVFKLDGADRYLHELPEFQEAWEVVYSKHEGLELGQCSITGNSDYIARLHESVKGIIGSAPSGAMLSSFNAESFQTHGKEQGGNASVGVTVKDKYILALRKLVKENKIIYDNNRDGGIDLVYWAITEDNSQYINVLNQLFGVQVVKEEQKQVDPKNTELIKSVLNLYRTGGNLATIPELTKLEDVEIYVLGLTARQTRAVVRFFEKVTFLELIANLTCHHADIDLETNLTIKAPTMKDLVGAVCPPMSANLPPNLIVDLAYAINTGSMYPESLYTQAITRFKVNQVKAPNEEYAEYLKAVVTHYRASLIKACLIRKARQKGTELVKELGEMLHEDSTNTAYQLGRAFAVLEKLQKEAVVGINTTIRTTHFGSASTTPALVFPQLMRKSVHHISKLSYGVKYDKVLSAILAPVEKFPTRLGLDDQGLFILGYYHQNVALYTPKKEEMGDNKDEC